MGPLGNGLDLLPHILLELIGALSVLCALIAIPPIVIEDKLRVLNEVFGCGVLVSHELVIYRTKIYRLFDDVVVIGYIFLVDSGEKGPQGLVVL